jgi:hypothetical protein
MKQLALAILLTLAVASSGQEDPSRQEPNPTSARPKCELCAPIEGNEHPELIPDSMAYRIWFTTAAYFLDQDAQHPDIAQGSFYWTHLGEVDQAMQRGVVLTWHQQQKDPVNAHNANSGEAARNETEFERAIQVKFCQDQADLALGTAKIPREQLSLDAAKTLEAVVQSHKEAISMNMGVI